MSVYGSLSTPRQGGILSRREYDSVPVHALCFEVNFLLSLDEGLFRSTVKNFIMDYLLVWFSASHAFFFDSECGVLFARVRSNIIIWVGFLGARVSTFHP